MLLTADVLERIQRGEVTLAFRRWRKPTVKAGGTLRTMVGVLAIDAVDKVAVGSITAAEARQAGYASLAALKSWLSARDGDTYRVAVRYVGEDPRIALRASEPSPAEITAIRDRLRRMDERSAHGPWTMTILRLIAANEGVRAPDLAASLGRETLPFKADVRKLKELGLTESLRVGYRLSPRGHAVVK
ncbi:hypothetical protein [Actinocrispum sp. NPDC049592]|uniref:hypothetical protein n=1 Tax=Actinocrispum sp. NPDC049592 TaxID=3154835 RepID=UPI00342C748C